MVTINGQNENIAGRNLYEYLEEVGYEIDRVVVELNLNILTKEELKTRTIKENDSIEVLRFVGGG